MISEKEQQITDVQIQDETRKLLLIHAQNKGYSESEAKTLINKLYSSIEKEGYTVAYNKFLSGLIG